MKLINVKDYEDEAKKVLPHDSWNYIYGASEDEITKRDNAIGFKNYKLIPRVLNDVNDRNYSSSILGSAISSPILLAPTSPMKMAHPDGELAQVRAAKKLDTIAICSTDSHFSLEDLAYEGNDKLWFQLYCYADRSCVEQMIVRAERSKYKALVITVDAFYPARRERMIRSDFSVPSDIQMGNLLHLDIPTKYIRNDGSVKRFALTWNDLIWVKAITKLPIILKGVMHPEDVAKAVGFGIQAVIISNHGGRQVDQSPSSISCLSDAVNVANGQMDILIDGGITRGTDILKAKALGAKAVLIGRSYIYGLAVNGQQGIEDVYNILLNEMDVAMSQLGISDINEINKSCLKFV
jgi:isopentenyl diphosphate isomerase/L-lactate dehydrogenase-like FMN-dependent dehydrogenase